MPIPLAVGISAGASLLGGVLGRNSARKQATAARQMANYNAKIVEMNAKADAQTIETSRKRFTKTQREGFAQARMSVASRGGRIEGTSLDALTEYAKEIQLDQMELKRQEELTRIRGENTARQVRYQGEVEAYNYRQAGQQAMMEGIIGAVGTIADYQSWNPATPKTPTPTPKPTMPVTGTDLFKTNFRIPQYEMYFSDNLLPQRQLNIGGTY